MGEVSGSRVEPSCLGTASINDETGAEIVDSSIVANMLVEAPTTGGKLSDKMLLKVWSF